MGSEGKTLIEVSDTTNVSKATIFDIKRMRTFKEINSHLNEKIFSFMSKSLSAKDKETIIENAQKRTYTKDNIFNYWLRFIKKYNKDVG